MNSHKNYLLQTKRLGFRQWRLSDIDLMHAINQDREVMEYFPEMPSKEKTEAFIKRMMTQYEEKGYCYFAVDNLETNEFIGFIGLSEQTYTSPVTPCIDIGSRIKSSEWNKGLATEGAQKCLEYAIHELKLPCIYSIAPKINVKSQHIMKKIGMRNHIEFEHPFLLHDARLKNCIAYLREEKIQIEAAIPNDHEALSILTKQSKQHWGYADQQIHEWRELLTISAEYIQTKSVFKLLREGEIIAYYSYFLLENQSVQLDNLFISPPYIRRGFGKLLMHDFISRMQQENMLKITLEAEPQAEKFYHHFGFKTVGHIESSIKDRCLPIMEYLTEKNKADSR